MDQEATPWRTVLRSADRLFRATTHPAAVDNDYAIWTAFDNHHWPAL
jgi:hypothetical protein